MKINTQKIQKKKRKGYGIYLVLFALVAALAWAFWPKSSVNDDNVLSNWFDRSTSDEVDNRGDAIDILLGEQNEQSIPVAAPIDIDNAQVLSLPALNELDTAPAEGQSNAEQNTGGQNIGTAIKNILQVTPQQKSWVSISDKTGQLYEGLMGVDEYFEREIQPPAKLHIGNAKSVEIKYRGVVLDLTPYTRGQVAKLTLEDTQEN